jgi:predicted regulator of Ras-like GTPase activity (Roadblock/LC7/MglB family)
VSGLDDLVTEFADRVPEVAHAVVVSAQGLSVAVSGGLAADRADQLAAVAAGLTSLMQGAARIFQGGPVAQTVVEMDRGVLIVMAFGQGAALAVLGTSACDLGQVCYEMALLAGQAGPALTAALRGLPAPAATARS